MIGAFGFLSEYNLLNSTYKLKDIINDAKSEDYPFSALNDTNNLYGSYKLFKHALTPYIIGMKLDIIHLGYECSVIAYAMDKEGYQNLNILSSTIQLGETKRLELNDILPFQKGLYFISSGHESNIDKTIINDNLNETRNILIDYKEKLNHFSIGLSLQSYVQERKVAPKLKELADEFKILLVPLNYMAYRKEDKETFNLIIKIQKEDNDFSDYDFSFQTLKELEKRYALYPEVFSNLKRIYPLFKFQYEKPKFNLPKVKGVKNSKNALITLTKKGLEKYLREERIKDKIVYYERLKKELTVIDSLGYNDYFLIVWDFVKYAKDNDILVGPGRGSAAGSLVSFALNITDVDPIKYGLLFERFLNKERKTMPDIDMDFPDDRREEVIEYIKNRYGSNRVLSINTFSKFSDKSSIRDVCRVKGYSPDRTNQIVKILTEQKENLSTELAEVKRLAEGLDGLPRQTGTHAAGIILAEEDLRYYLPLQQGPTIYQAQFEHEDLVDMGLLKIDLLGIRNLTIIKRTLEIIKEKRNIDININKLSLNDKKTYELLSAGDTLGIFQLESQGMRNVLRKLKPNKFNDLVALLALYRPGPMENIDVYINRRNGEKFSYIDNSLAKILKETYGIIVYQEQIILIAEEFAGYTLSEADMLRVGISKKDKKILNEERKIFVEKSIKNNRPKELAEKIYDYIVRFADYGFNKSHSVAYALVAYQMAYLKANYYDVFMAVLLSKMVNDTNIFYSINDLRKRGIIVYPPNINISTDEYLVAEKGIYYPLLGIKGIGTQIVKRIIEEREKNGLFKNYDDFKLRLNGVLSDKMLENLIFSGALNCFKLTKHQMYEERSASTILYEDLIVDIIEKVYEEYDLEYLAEKEKEALGFNLDVSPLTDIIKYEKEHKLTSIKNLTFKKSSERVVGLVKRVSEITTKSGEKMAFITMTDYLGDVEITVFPEVYEKHKEILVENEKIVVNIQSQKYGGGSWILKDATVMR
ncbi:MAG TPA: DNA polymerase III subunit alpha [Acholeplasma sp.]|nr:DNA polymerase III subunit alpha [Acholeplasma sp.]